MGYKETRSDKIVCPGFIDAHIHPEASLVSPAEFGGESPLTMRYGLRRSNNSLCAPRPVTSIRSAYGIRQT